MAIRNLDKILRPKRIAVIGASNKPERLGFVVLRNLRAAEFPGVIYPVHPSEEEIQGLPAVSSLAELPEPVDLAIVCTRAETVPKILRQAGEAGVGAMIITSAGFREIGGFGNELQQRLHATASKFPELRILGPNSMGIIVPHLKLNATFATSTPKPGRIAFVSQSGTLCTSALIGPFRRTSVFRILFPSATCRILGWRI